MEKNEIRFLLTLCIFKKGILMVIVNGFLRQTQKV